MRRPLINEHHVIAGLGKIGADAAANRTGTQNRHFVFHVSSRVKDSLTTKARKNKNTKKNNE
jgi:hypothetical protein